MTKKLFLPVLFFMSLLFAPTQAFTPAANGLPKLKFKKEESRLSQLYDKALLMYNDTTNSTYSDELPIEEGSEKYRHTIRMMICTYTVAERENFSGEEWMLTLSRLLDAQYFKKSTVLDDANFSSVSKVMEEVMNSVEPLTGSHQQAMNHYAYLDRIHENYLALLKSYTLAHHHHGKALSQDIITQLDNETRAWWSAAQAVGGYYHLVRSEGSWFSMKPLFIHGLESLFAQRRLETCRLLESLLYPDAHSAATDSLQDKSEGGHESYETLYTQLFSQEVRSSLTEENTLQAFDNMKSAWDAYVKCRRSSSYHQKDTTASEEDLRQYLQTIADTEY